MRHEALEVPGASLAVGGWAERHDAGLARAQVLDDMLDRPVLPGGVAALEDHQHALALSDHVSL